MIGIKGILAGIGAVSLVAAALYGGAGLLAGTQAAPLETASTGSPAFAGAAFAFQDPSGDASEVVMGDAGTYGGCIAGYVLQGACMEPLPVPGSPAPAAHVDIIGVRLGERADDVVLALEIARLDDGYAQLATPDAVHRMTTYGICWYDAEGSCTRAAYLDVMVHDGVGHAEARFDAYDDACNEWRWCATPIPADVRFGAPAQIIFAVPKSVARVVGDLDVHHLDAWTGWSDEATAFPMWHGGATLHTPARHVHDHTPNAGTFGIADMTEAFPVGTTLAPAARAPPAPPLDVPLARGHGGMTHAHGSSYDRAELDLAGFDLYEEEGGLTVLLALQEADAQPAFDFDYSVVIAFEDGNVAELGVRQEQGRAVGYAGHCIMEGCQDALRFEVPFEFVPGAPAYVVLRIPAEVAEELFGAREGDATTLLWASTMMTEGSQYFGDEGGAVYGDVHHAFMVDEIVGGAPFVWGSGHRADLAGFATAEPHHHGSVS